MIHIYTGNGKGKTTAALGMLVRSLGWRHPVCLCQFLKGKGNQTGEIQILQKIRCRQRPLRILCFDQTHPIFRSSDISRSKQRQQLKKSLTASLATVSALIRSKKYKVIILDEIINAVSQGFLKESRIIKLLKYAPDSTEIVLTGRGASKKLMKHADYVTEMRQIKHPFRKKIHARKGIEF